MKSPIQDDLDAVGALAIDIKQHLSTIDAAFLDRSSAEKNKALRLDPRKLYEEITGHDTKFDLAQQIVNERTVMPDGRVTLPKKLNIPVNNLPEIGVPIINTNAIQQKPETNWDSNQLELGLQITVNEIENYTNLNDIANLIKRKIDNLEFELNIIKKFLSEIRTNTTKRKKEIK